MATFKEMDNYIVFAVVRLLRVDVIDAMAAEVVGGGTAGAPVIIIYSINIGYIILDEAALNSWAARAAAGYSRPATATSFSLMPITAPRTTRELVMPDNTPQNHDDLQQTRTRAACGHMSMTRIHPSTRIPSVDTRAPARVPPNHQCTGVRQPQDHHAAEAHGTPLTRRSRRWAEVTSSTNAHRGRQSASPYTNHASIRRPSQR